MGGNNNGDINHNNNDSKMRDFKITKKDGEWYNTIVTDYDKESFDKWMKDLIDQNGVTKY